jgi:hypothetical protein
MTHISMNVRLRMKVEELLVKQVVAELLAAGYSLGVHDGEELTIHHSRNLNAIVKKLFTADRDDIYVYVDGGNKRDTRCDYWVRCVYGNEGIDVISDYSLHLEPQIKPVMALAEALESGAFSIQINPVPVEV